MGSLAKLPLCLPQKNRHFAIFFGTMVELGLFDQLIGLLTLKPGRAVEILRYRRWPFWKPRRNWHTFDHTKLQW